MSPPVPPSAPTASRGLSVGDLLAAGGGVLVVAFSFAPFVRYGGEIGEGLAAGGATGVFNAWSLTTFMVPLTTFVVLAGLLGIAAVAVRFWLRRDPELAGFWLRQLEVGLALFMFVVLLGMITSAKHVLFGAHRSDNADAFTLSPMDVGWGAVLMLIGAMVALAGAVLNHFGIGPVIRVPGAETATGEPSPPAEASWQHPATPEPNYRPRPPAAPGPSSWRPPGASEPSSWQRPAPPEQPPAPEQPPSEPPAPGDQPPR